MRADLCTVDDRVIAAWLQPRVALETIAASLELGRADVQARLLAHTGVFVEDTTRAGRLVSARGFERLLANTFRHARHAEFPFQLGEQLYREGLGPLRPLASAAGTLRERVELIVELHPLAAPLATISLHECGDESSLLTFTSSSGLVLDPRYLETTLVTIARLLGDEDPGSWELFLPYRKPAHLEQYHAYLTTRLYFGAPFAGIRLSPSPADSTADTNAALLDECQHLLGTRTQLLTALRAEIRATRDLKLSLADTAAWCRTSPATLKRKLAECGASHQKLLDSCRCEHATVELLLNGASVEALSQNMHFGDSSNFRRAFKRWTGTTPSYLREAYALTLRV